jgi:hypothetical protein
MLKKQAFPKIPDGAPFAKQRILRLAAPLLFPVSNFAYIPLAPLNE